MTTKDTADQDPEATPSPAPAPEPAAEPAKPEAKEQPRAGLPLGHILLGGASATTLGGFWLASAVGPWAVAGVGAGAVAAGGAYVHHRMNKRRGQSGMTRTVRTQTSRSGGGALGRMGLGGARRGGGAGSAGSSGGSRSQRRTSSAASGPAGASRHGSGAAPRSAGAPKRGGTASGAGSARPAGGRGSSSRGGLFGRGAGGRGSAGRRGGGGGGGSAAGRRGQSGGSGRGLLGRRSGGSGGGSGRGLLGRRSGGGTASRKGGLGRGTRHTTPPGDGGMPPSSGSKRSRTRMGRGRTRKEKGGGGAVGATPKTSPRGGGTRGRWGGASGTTAGSRTGRLRAMGRRLGGWADGRTGHRGSTAWRAASGTRGFRNRRRAAKEALRGRTNHHRLATPAFAAFGAVAASLWAWGGRVRANQHARAHRAMDNVDPDATTEHTAHSGAGTPTADAVPNAAPNPGPETPPAPEQPNTAAPAAPTPASPTGPTGRTTMAGLPHAQHAADMRSAAGRYEPDDIFKAIEEARYWTDAVDDFAESVRAYARRMHAARFPFHSDVYDALEELYTAIAKARPAAENIEPTMRTRNSADVDRNENPRGDETKANVAR